MHTELLDPSTQKRGDYKEFYTRFLLTKMITHRLLRAFNLAEYAHGKPQQPLPTSLAPHEAMLGWFADSCKALCMKLLELIAYGLGIPEHEGGKSWFSSRHGSLLGPSGCTLRLLFVRTILSTLFCELLTAAYSTPNHCHQTIMMTIRTSAVELTAIMDH